MLSWLNAMTRLLDRLAASLDALGTGAVDLPERQRTLRATVEWSVGLLTDDERSLLESAAVFTDGWSGPAAAAVAGLGEGRALELSEALARHSLIYLDSTKLRPRTGWKARPRACVGGSACGRGRTCGGWRPIWWPRSACGWARPDSIRRSRPAPGSPSSRRSPPSGTSPPPAPARP